MADPMETEDGINRVRESPDAEAARLVQDLEHQIDHLVRSNRELEEFLKDNTELDAAGQKELRVAIGENIVTIARRRAILEDLYQQAGMAEGAPDANAEGVAPAVDADTGVYL
jgi:hypothetical protein